MYDHRGSNPTVVSPKSLSRKRNENMSKIIYAFSFSVGHNSAVLATTLYEIQDLYLKVVIN